MAFENNKTIKIGTRGSALALAQAHEVKNLLCSANRAKQGLKMGFDEDQITIHVISTKGDEIQDRPLSEVGGKGLFSKEIELALSKEEIDIAVHSTKDMATQLPDDLEITSYLEREDPRDAFISKNYARFEDLPHGATVGSSSMRRKALILNKRPDLNVVMYRGNVQTRLKKLAEGEVDATFLAFAGLKRLGLADTATQVLAIDDFMPAPAQGAICIETRAEDVEIFPYIRALNHFHTEVAILCERAFLRTLDGSCQTPISGIAQMNGKILTFVGQVLSEDGKTLFKTELEGNPSDPEALGVKAGNEILKQTGPDFFKNWNSG